MRLRRLSFAATVVFSYALPATSQIACGGSTCIVGLKFETGGETAPVITGAPYSGLFTHEDSRTSPDGAPATKKSFSFMTYRDSKGRVRTEQPIYPHRAAGEPAPPDNFIVVEIHDPVAGFQYILDPVNRVAHRMPLQPRTVGRFQAPGKKYPNEPYTVANPDGWTTEIEPLGTQTVSGVATIGTRITNTAPGVTSEGRTIRSTDERWRDPRTGVELLVRTINTDGSTVTQTMVNYAAEEPDPSLFRIPDGYQVVDETGAFKVVHARNGGAGPSLR